MLTPILRDWIERYRAANDCEVYVIIDEIRPGECMILVVPHGSERELTVNPLGSRAGARAPGGPYTRPTLEVIHEAMLPGDPTPSWMQEPRAS